MTSYNIMRGIDTVLTFQQQNQQNILAAIASHAPQGRLNALAYLQENNLPIPTSAYDDFFASQAGLDYMISHLEGDALTSALIATGQLQQKNERVLLAMEEVHGAAEVGGIEWDWDEDGAVPERSEEEKSAMFRALLQLNNPFPTLDAIANRYVTTDSFAGQIALGIFHRHPFWDEGNYKEFSEMTEAVLGIPQERMYRIFKQTGYRFEQGLQTIFEEYGFGNFFHESISVPPIPTAPEVDVEVLKGSYTNEPIRIAVNTTSLNNTYLHFDLYVMDANTGKQIWKKQLNGTTQNQLYTDLAMEEIGALSGMQLKIMGVAWFDEKYTDAQGHEQNVHASGLSESFSIHWNQENGELPPANQAVIDYLHNEVLPTLIPVYGSDGVTIDRWEATESSGLSCKEWVQITVMNDVFGLDHPTIPNNDSDNYSKWILDDQDDVIELSAITLTSNGEQQVIINYFQDLQAGDVIQAKVLLANGGFGPHTFILDKKTENGIWVFDSNWSIEYDKKVRYHYLSYETISDWGAMTAYRIQEP